MGVKRANSTTLQDAGASPNNNVPTWLPFSRGWREHLARLSGNSVKLYNLLLIDAAFGGPNKGQVATSFTDLANALGIGKSSVKRAARELRPHYIRWQPAANQYGTTVFVVQRYKTTADFAGPLVGQQKSGRATSGTANPSAGPRAAQQTPWAGHQRHGTRRKPNGQRRLAAPKKEEKKRRTTPPPSEVVCACRDYAHKSFAETRGQKPAWAVKDYVQLFNLLRRNAHITTAEFSRRWDRYMGSTEHFIQQQGFSLAYFCSRFDAFMAGPLHDRVRATSSKSNGHGDLRRFDNVGRRADGKPYQEREMVKARIA